MRNAFAFLPLVLLVTSVSARSAETLVPAGSLIECTVSEPNFSSKTAELGDPVLCQAGLVEGAWGSALPYGTYLIGRFAEYKDPGHFVGKGWMELKFDRMVLPPDRVLPLSAKVVYVQGMPVDRLGRIHGTGHAVRDVVEWSIPVLWPIDIFALPRRGPRPKLKEESRLRLKVMDDMAIPIDQPAQRTMLPMSGFATRPAIPDAPVIVPSVYYRQPPVAPVRNVQPSSNQQLTILMLNDGNGRMATNYWFEGGRQLRYIGLNGTAVVIPIESLDLSTTVEINLRRGVPFLIRSAGAY